MNPLLRLCALAAGLFLSVSPGAAKEPPPWLAESYGGKYADDPFGKGFLADLPRFRREAIERMERRTGIVPAEPDRIGILVLDAEALPEKEREKWRREAFSVARAPEGGAFAAVVALYLEPFASGEALAEPALARALVKAAFLARFSDKDLKRIPDWIVEGLALYAGGDDEGEAVVERILAARRKPVETLLGDLEGRHEKSDLAQDFWAFLWLEKEKGRRAVQSFGKGVYEGKPYDETLMGIAGKGWGGITGEVADFARKELAPLSAGTEAWKALEKRVRAAPEEDWRRFTDEISGLIEKHRRAWWADKARYLLARAREEGGQTEQASEAYQDIADGVPPRSPFVADARYRWALMLEKRGRREDAEREFARCVRDHFEEPFVDDALESLARLSEKRRDADAAARWRVELDRWKARKEAAKKEDGASKKK